MTKADELLDHAQGDALLADGGYDSDTFIGKVRRKGMKVVIPSGAGRKYNRRRLDRKLYRRRYLVEVCFHNLKRSRAVATRFEKSARNYLAVVHLACALIWLN